MEQNLEKNTKQTPRSLHKKTIAFQSKIQRENHLIKEYIQRFAQENIEKIIPSKIPYTITFYALPGMGKSTIATQLQHDTGLPILSSDKIRRFLESKGYEPDNVPGSLIKAIFEGCLYLVLYNNKSSFIVDSDVGPSYQPAKKRADNQNYQLIVINLDCNEDKILDRLAKREQLQVGEATGYSHGTRTNYYERKQENRDIPDVFFTINTSEPLASVQKQVAAFEQSLQNFLDKAPL